MHPGEYQKLKDGTLQAKPLPVDSDQSATTTHTNVSPRGPPLDDDALLTSAQVRARVGNVTTMCIWRWMRDERVQFPLPVKINSRNYWRLGDLRRWQSERVEQKAA